MAGSVPGSERMTKVPMSRPSADQAFSFEVPVGLEHRVRVDRQLGDHLLGGRQLVSGLEDAELQGLVDLLDQLQVGGDARSGIELEFDHEQLCFH